MADSVDLPVHGGDISAWENQFGVMPPWLDFSANINPLGPPAGVVQALRRAACDPSALAEYPTRRERLLRSALAAYHQLAPEQIVIANGASALIEAFVRTFAPQRCLLPQPAFSEYGRALQAQGTHMLPYQLDPTLRFQLQCGEFLAVVEKVQPDAIILTNPHNPSGVLLEPATLRSIIEICKTVGIALLLDEAFIDYCPEASMLDGSSDAFWGERVVILRSLTKFYGMPGLRVGYAVTHPHLAVKMTARIPSWPITASAIDATLAAIADNEYALRTRALNIRSRDVLVSQLMDLGVTVVPSAANFLLIAGPWQARDCADWLAEYHHIAVRDCTSYGIPTEASYIRVAVRLPAENERLIRALTEYLSC